MYQCTKCHYIYSGPGQCYKPGCNDAPIERPLHEPPDSEVRKRTLSDGAIFNIEGGEIAKVVIRRENNPKLFDLLFMPTKADNAKAESFFAAQQIARLPDPPDSEVRKRSAAPWRVGFRPVPFDPAELDKLAAIVFGPGFEEPDSMFRARLLRHLKGLTDGS